MTMARPTPEQSRWQDHEIGLFIHYDLPVFKPAWNHRDYDNWQPPEIFNPKQLDTDQWMEAARALGARYALLTATHGTGFMLWQSDAYPYGVRQSPWRNGRGDVVRDFVESCGRSGVTPGLYSHMKCNGYWEVDHPGLANRGQGGDPSKQDRYVRARLAAIEELWGNYGPVGEIWFDGGTPDVALTGLDVLPALRRLQPNAMVLNSPAATIRWIGNEKGTASYPCWATVQSVEEATTYEERGMVHRLLTGDPDGAAWLPGECDTPVRRGTWMWEPDTEDRLLSVDELMEIYCQSVGRNCNLLLNATPDQRGLIPEPDMRRYRELGTEIRRRFATSLAEATGAGTTTEVSLQRPGLVDHVVIMERIEEGERIRSYSVEGWRSDHWQPLCHGQSVGHKRIERFEPTEVSKVRLRVLRATAEPLIRRFAVFRCAQ